MKRFRWTDETDEVLRESYRSAPIAALAARLGVNRGTVCRRARSLGLLLPRLWSAEQLAQLREHYGRLPTPQVAALVGKTVHQVHAKASGLRLGFGWRQRLGDRHDAEIRELSAQGYPDDEIAGVLDVGRKAITHRRQQLGLPDNSRSERVRQRIARKTQDQCRAAGVRTLAQVRRLAYDAFARESGWPQDLRPRAVMILNLLAAAGVPLTRRQICEGIGMRWKGPRASLVSNDERGSYLAYLASRKLVLRLPKAHQVLGKGRGKSLDLYCLGEAALEILVRRAEEASRADGK